MKSKTLLLLLLALPFLSSSQSIDSLSLEKHDLEFEIKSLEIEQKTIEDKIKKKQSKLKEVNTRISSIKDVISGNTTPVPLRVYYSTSKDTYMYSHPNTDEGGKLIRKKSRVYVRELAENNFYEVSYKGLVGYMKRDVFTAKESKEVKLNTSSVSKSTYKYSSSSSSYSKPKRKTSYRTYYRGSRGGCYYINSNGNKTYVDRSKCK